MNLTLALTSAYPGAQWSCSGGTTDEQYASLKWGGPGNKPTLDELKAAWAELNAPKPITAVPALNLLHVLIDAGLYPIVTSTINGIADPAERLKAQETFRRAATIERQHPLVLLVAQAAGKTSDEIDAYFRQAAQA